MSGLRDIAYTAPFTFKYFDLKQCLKQFKPTLFNNYSDNLQLLQICQVGEYPGVKIQNVIGTKVPVK